MPRRVKEPAGLMVPGEYAQAVDRTLTVLGGKWTIQIIARLLEGTCRFGELMHGLGGVSPKMLVSRLRELESQGLVVRTLYPEIPPRVEYALTPEGRTLQPIITAITQWGATHGERIEKH